MCRLITICCLVLLCTGTCFSRGVTVTGKVVDYLARTVAEAVHEPVIPFAIRWQSRVYSLLGLAALLVVVVVFATTLGSVSIPFTTTFQVLLSQMPFVDIAPFSIDIYGAPLSLEVLRTIVIDIRLPRILLAGLVGAALAVAGATYQGLFRNPLADPYLLGVASGAGLGATVAMLIPFTVAWMASGAVPLFAFIGAMCAVAVVYSLVVSARPCPPPRLSWPE